MIAARMANVKVGGDRKSKNQSLKLDSDSESLKSAAEKMNVSDFSVKAAKRVLDEGGPGVETPARM